MIASDAGGAAEIVKHEHTGLLTPMGNATAIANAIRRMLANPDLADSLARAGYADACERFRIEDRVAETNAVIEEVVGSRQ